MGNIYIRNAGEYQLLLEGNANLLHSPGSSLGGSAGIDVRVARVNAISWAVGARVNASTTNGDAYVGGAAVGEVGILGLLNVEAYVGANSHGPTAGGGVSLRVPLSTSETPAFVRGSFDAGYQGGTTPMFQLSAGVGIGCTFDL